VLSTVAEPRWLCLWQRQARHSRPVAPAAQSDPTPLYKHPHLICTYHISHAQQWGPHIAIRPTLAPLETRSHPQFTDPLHGKPACYRLPPQAPAGGATLHSPFHYTHPSAPDLTSKVAVTLVWCRHLASPYLTPKVAAGALARIGSAGTASRRSPTAAEPPGICPRGASRGFALAEPRGLGPYELAQGCGLQALAHNLCDVCHGPCSPSGSWLARAQAQAVSLAAALLGAHIGYPGCHPRPHPPSPLAPSSRNPALPMVQLMLSPPGLSQALSLWEASESQYLTHLIPPPSRAAAAASRVLSSPIQNVTPAPLESQAAPLAPPVRLCLPSRDIEHPLSLRVLAHSPSHPIPSFRSL